MKKCLFNTFAIFFLSFLSSFAQVIPQVEIRINNSATAKDDYVNTSYIPCNIRLINGASFSSDIPVSLRNIQFATGGRVLFSTSGGSSSGSSALSLTLRRNNVPSTFYIRNSPGFSSVVDKDAIIEIIDRRESSNPVVLGRKALMVVSGSPLPLSTPQIEILVNTASSLDDYITWSPTLCRIRLTNGSSFTSPLNVTLRNLSNSIGKVNFANSSLPYNSTATNSTLNISLPNTGTWVNFYISGKYGSPSLRDKDAIIEVVKSGTQANPGITLNGTVLTREPLMVRVRKDANTVAPEERERFLNALTVLNNTFNGYIVFNDIHMEAANPEAHNGPGFLAWHRAFTLMFERKLQMVDPSVSLLYWRFDLAGSNVFSMDFMGSKPTVSSDAFVDFNGSDPLIAWNMIGGPGIRRTTVFANNVAPPTVKASWLSETATLALGTSYSAFRAMESNPHNLAHDRTGGAVGDWLKTVNTSLRDPLFFLLHGNVDRLWARWQWINDRFDVQSSSTYSPQGSFPNSGTIHIGHYLNDTMWPWNGITGTYTGVGTALINDRPTTAPGGPIPNALSITAPGSTPNPLSVIDYRNNRLTNVTNSGMGFCYDDVPFQ